MKTLNLKSKNGCLKVIAILLVMILVCSFVANLISSDFGKVKVSKIVIDSRGAELSFDQYVPAGVSDADALPAIVTIHGGGCPAGVMRGIAEELAKRGFVGVNLNAYGAGTSEQPLSDDGGQGAAGLTPFGGPQGVIDAVNYLRSLHFVDSERIGLVGHSLGATRSSNAALADCGYLTLNDLLVNVLYDTFGVEIDADECLTPADELAAKYLNADQMAYYEAIKAETTEYFNTRIKSVCILGSDAAAVYPQQTVTVAGHEVTRSLQTNIAVINGLWDTNGRGSLQNVGSIKAALYMPDADVATDTWYALDDEAKSATAIGGLFAVSAESDAALAQAIADRSVRAICINEETHSKNFFSVQTTKDIVKVNEQLLGYNGGNLGQGNNPVAAEKGGSFIWRAIFNCIAMLCMLGLIFPVVALLVECEFFKECVGTKEPSKAGAYSKKYWLFAAIIVVYTFVAIYYGNTKGVMRFPINHTWPLAGTAGNTILFVLILAGCSLAMLVVYAIIGKKTCGETGLTPLFGGVGVKGVLKSLLIALITLVIGYATLMMISYLFNQDYRFWMTSFGEMRVELWFIAARYALAFMPVYLLIGAVINYTVRNDIGEWKDTAINVLIGSLGVWLCCAVDLLLCKFGNYNGTHFAAFTCSYSMLLYVPITIVISRKLYNITKNIWTGAFVNAVFLAWSFTAAQTLSDKFFGQNILSIFFGA